MTLSATPSRSISTACVSKTAQGIDDSEIVETGGAGAAPTRPASAGLR